MPTPITRDLETFNRFILQIEDRAYTLASHLTGQNPLTERIVQDSFRELFSQWQRSGFPDQDMEPRLLKALIQRCRQASPVLGPANLLEPFSFLDCDQKLALILVDCLACTHQEAARILACPLPKLRRTLACARYKVSIHLPSQKLV